MANDRYFVLLEVAVLTAVSAAILAVLVWAQQYLSIPRDALIEPTWLAIAFAPWLIWLVATGRLQEFSILSVSAKLRTFSSQSVMEHSRIEDEMVSEMAASDPTASLSDVARERPVILTLRLGMEVRPADAPKHAGYTDKDIETWVSRLHADNLKYVAFVDGEKRLCSYLPAPTLLAYLNTQTNKLSTKIAQKYIPSNIIGLRSDRLAGEISNRKALEYLSRKKLDDVAVVNTNGELVGLLQASDLATRYLLALTHRRDQSIS